MRNVEAREDVEGLRLRCPREATNALLLSVPQNDLNHRQALRQGWWLHVASKLKRWTKCRLTERAQQKHRLDYFTLTTSVFRWRTAELDTCTISSTPRGHETDQPQLFRLFTSPGRQINGSLDYHIYKATQG